MYTESNPEPRQPEPAGSGYVFAVSIFCFVCSCFMLLRAVAPSSRDAETLAVCTFIALLAVGLVGIALTRALRLLEARMSRLEGLAKGQPQDGEQPRQ
jgi:hypothetical protein